MTQTRKLINEDSWVVKRTARLEEVKLDNGEFRYNAQIFDEGRESPFLSRWFSDPVPASRFIDKIRYGFDTHQGGKKNGGS